jgi:uroporphyrinogen decarboxylase
VDKDSGIRPPRYRQIIPAITKPWVFHSDGNYSAVVEDLITLGCQGFHPFEVGAMNIFKYK